MLHFLRYFARDEQGAASVEYVLLYAVVGTGFVAGALFLGQKIASAMQTHGDLLEACVAGSSTRPC